MVKEMRCLDDLHPINVRCLKGINIGEISSFLVYDEKRTDKIRLIEDKDMRFRAVNEKAYWQIEDSFDEENPLNNFYGTKGLILEVRDWLNENVKELSFKEKVKKVIDELWDEDEIVVDEWMDYIVVTEIKATSITAFSIKKRLDCEVKNFRICSGKHIFRIKEV